MEKLRRLGVEAETSDFLTSVDALIAHLHAQGMAEKLLYVCGTQSMKRQLTQAGLRLTDDRDAAVDALVMGFDTELTFQKLEDACILLNRGADYLATNPDWVCPTWYGFVPDCGSVCEMLFRATGRRPMSSASRGWIWRALRWRAAAFRRGDGAARRPALHRHCLRRERGYRHGARPLGRDEGGRPRRQRGAADICPRQRRGLSEHFTGMKNDRSCGRFLRSIFQQRLELHAAQRRVDGRHEL